MNEVIEILSSIAPYGAKMVNQILQKKGKVDGYDLLVSILVLTVEHDKAELQRHNDLLSVIKDTCEEIKAMRIDQIRSKKL